MTLPYFRPNRLYWIYIQFRPQTVPFCAVLIYESISCPGGQARLQMGQESGHWGTKTVRESGFELPLYRLPPRFSCVAARNISQKSYEIESSIGKRRRRIY